MWFFFLNTKIRAIANYIYIYTLITIIGSNLIDSDQQTSLVNGLACFLLYTNPNSPIHLIIVNLGWHLYISFTSYNIPFSENSKLVSSFPRQWALFYYKFWYKICFVICLLDNLSRWGMCTLNYKL